MFDFIRKKRLYSFASATFELGVIGFHKKEHVTLSLSGDTTGDSLNDLDWVCLLTKRATVQAIKSNPDVDPYKLSIKLVDLDLRA